MNFEAMLARLSAWTNRGGQQEVPELFYSEHCVLAQALSKTQATSVNAAQLIELLQPTLDEVLLNAPKLAPAWQLLRPLVFFQLKPKSVAPTEFVTGLQAIDMQFSVCPQFLAQDWTRELGAAARWLEDHYGAVGNGGELSWADWHLRHLICEMILGKNNSDSRIESTPILLAGQANELVFDLCCEAIPSVPGLVVPHWQKLWLAPLGNDFGLFKAIQKGMRFAMNTEPVACQLRWWLVPRSKGNPWNSNIDANNPSVEVSSAIVARCALLAFANKKLSSRLLSPNVAVSAAIGSGDTFEGTRLERVGNANLKMAAAGAAGVHKVIFGKDTETEHAADPHLLKRDTIGEAWELMLQSASAIRRYKENFNSIGYNQPWSKHWVEVKTHRRFRDPNTRRRVRQKKDSGSRADSGNPLLRSAVDDHLKNLEEVFSDPREHFLIRQSYFVIAPKQKSESIWQLVESENTSTERGQGKWISRRDLVEHAISGTFRRVGLICGAGLGKTTTLAYLEAAINRADRGWFNRLAIRWELRTLLEISHAPGGIQQSLRRAILDRICSMPTVQQDDTALEICVNQMLDEGRVVFLFDSLDQSEYPKKALDAIMNSWKECPVWITGRPYAFRRLSEAEPHLMDNWQFLKVGKLKEPEARQLLETADRRKWKTQE